jgi:transposase
VVDTDGLPVRLALTTGEAHDNRLAANYLAFVQLASIGLWLRANEPTAW